MYFITKIPVSRLYRYKIAKTTKIKGKQNSKQENANYMYLRQHQQTARRILRYMLTYNKLLVNICGEEALDERNFRQLNPVLDWSPRLDGTMVLLWRFIDLLGFVVIMGLTGNIRINWFQFTTYTITDSLN
uniref:Uncharacterized protein n=1 Tax=Glossina austeni TaxID=7395 RepID=A0A1A9UWF7_GLOAU